MAGILAGAFGAGCPSRPVNGGLGGDAESATDVSDGEWGVIVKPLQFRHIAAAGAVLLLMTAATPSAPDRTARAPVLTGYGQLSWPISTTSPQAQQLFVQGVLQAYAFNEAEAVRSFKAALAQDPDCALCAWGVAWQLGPNINNHSRASEAEALRYTAQAVSRSQRTTPREQALIEAMALRYGHASQARETAPLMAARCGPKSSAGTSAGTPGTDDSRGDNNAEAVHPLDQAYADRLRRLVDATPGDADLLTLYAEAELIATPGASWHPRSGQPQGRIGALMSRLEAALQTQPQHTGLNHYLVHAADAPAAAQRAVAAADRLAVLAPAAAHLVHMPSHIYVRVGRYADATAVNQAAVAADLAFFETLKTQGFDVSKDWRGHNQSFLWFAALMQGRGDLAVATARDVASRATGDHAYAEYQRSLPLLALQRLERWEALLAEAVPASSRGLAQALAESARGVAHMRSGRADEARASLQRAQAGAATLAKAHSAANGEDLVLRDMASSALDRLRAEIASAEGRHADALSLQTQAVATAQRADSSEPPLLAAGARLVLGDLQLRAGRAAAAEKTFRDDLAAQPGSGWALAGLTRALQAQGRTKELAPLQAQLQAAWVNADAALLARR